MKYRSPTARFLSYVWRFKLTRAGRILLFGLSFSLLGTVSVQVPIYQIFFSLMTLLTVAWLAGLVFRPYLDIAGEFPAKTTAGEPVTGEFTLKNRGWLPAFDLMIGFIDLPRSIVQRTRDQIVESLGRSKNASLHVTLEPRRRGLYPLPDLRAFSTFPFNVVRSGAARASNGSLIVLPAFHRLIAVDVPLGSRYQPGGIALTSKIGESPEYIGNREYIPGEPARRLDFRSWARLGKPVVREYQDEYYCRIALVLDTFIVPRRRERAEGFPELEAAISLTASIADALSGGEYIIDLFAAGPELYVFRAGRHTAHFDNVLEILAGVDACRRDPFDTVTPAVAEELNNISTAICVFLDWDAARRGLAQAALEAGCSVKVLIVRNGETTEPIHSGDVEDITVYSIDDVQSGRLEAV